MKHICATLLLLCNTLNGDLDLDFIEEVKACALQYNAIVESPERIPINLVLAQAILESNWGKSRFAVSGNNLFGIKAVSQLGPLEVQSVIAREQVKKSEKTYDGGVESGQTTSIKDYNFLRDRYFFIDSTSTTDTVLGTISPCRLKFTQ